MENECTREKEKEKDRERVRVRDACCELIDRFTDKDVSIPSAIGVSDISTLLLDVSFVRIEIINIGRHATLLTS